MLTSTKTFQQSHIGTYSAVSAINTAIIQQSFPFFFLPMCMIDYMYLIWSYLFSILYPWSKLQPPLPSVRSSEMDLRGTLDNEMNHICTFQRSHLFPPLSADSDDAMSTAVSERVFQTDDLPHQPPFLTLVPAASEEKFSASWPTPIADSSCGSYSRVRVIESF